MSNPIFSVTELSDLLSRYSVVNVTDPETDAASLFLKEAFRNSVQISGKQFASDMLQAVIGGKTEKFRRKYCEVPFLILMLESEDIIKSAFQQELVYILNVRHYKKMPTVLLTSEQILKYSSANDSLISYSHASCRIR